jgi:hypothetical protein
LTLILGSLHLQKKEILLMSKIPMVVRYLLGIVYVVFGLNGFLHFMPNPDLPAGAKDFIVALMNSGYLMYVVNEIVPKTVRNQLGG